MLKERIKSTPLIGHLTVSLYSKYLRYRNRKFLSKNKTLRDAKRGARCFIIATGPSIKTQDLKPLKGEFCISVSNFFLHPDFNVIKPEFHLFVASHPPVTEEQYGAWFKDAEKRFPPGQKVLISITDKHIVERYKAFKNNDVFYYSLGHKPLKDSIDFSKDIPMMQTSAQTAMYLALYLGTKEMVLLGCDHDWLLHLGETRHFYNEKQSVLTQKGYNEWFEEDLEVQFSSHVHLWQVYKQIRAYCSKRNIPIYNCTPTSLLDVFPKKKLEEVLQK